MRGAALVLVLLSACGADLDDPLSSCCDGRQTCLALASMDDYVCRRCDCLSCRNTPLALEWCEKVRCWAYDSGNGGRCQATGEGCGRRIAQVGSEMQVTELAPCRQSP